MLCWVGPCLWAFDELMNDEMKEERKEQMLGIDSLLFLFLKLSMARSER